MSEQILRFLCISFPSFVWLSIYFICIIHRCGQSVIKIAPLSSCAIHLSWFLIILLIMGFLSTAVLQITNKTVPGKEEKYYEMVVAAWEDKIHLHSQVPEEMHIININTRMNLEIGWTCIYKTIMGGVSNLASSNFSGLPLFCFSGSSVSNSFACLGHHQGRLNLLCPSVLKSLSSEL